MILQIGEGDAAKLESSSNDRSSKPEVDHQQNCGNVMGAFLKGLNKRMHLGVQVPFSRNLHISDIQLWYFVQSV